MASACCARAGAASCARRRRHSPRWRSSAAALERAARAKVPAVPWTVTWFTGQVNKQNGRLDEAIAAYRAVINTEFAEARKREFDFGKDYTALAELGQTLYERSKIERGEKRSVLLREAAGWFEKVL